MKIKAIRTRIFKERENLENFVLEHVANLKDGAVLVVTSKIVALSEGRTAQVSEKAHIIKKESEWVILTKHASLTFKDGMLMTNAGIDESNAQGKLILLPKNSFATAARLRKALLAKYNIKNLGIIITDSRTVPLRVGSMGVAVGYSGFEGIKNYKGASDLFGRTLVLSKVDVVDSLAAAAVFLMGEGDERKPLAIIENAPVRFCEQTDRRELFIAIEDDLYFSLLKKPKQIAKKRTEN